MELLITLLTGLICECSQCVCEPPSEEPDTSLCAEPLSFTAGTLWKPFSDSDGRLVILLAPQHDYERCEVKRKNGTYEELEFRGRSNGDRQTWRGDFPGGPAYAGKKDGGGVRCFVEESVCEFPIPGAPKRRWE